MTTKKPKPTWGGKRPGAGRKPEQFIAGATACVTISHADGMEQKIMTLTDRTESSFTLSDGVTIVTVTVSGSSGIAR